MRKDVRFGLTIGGILALVLVVWLALTDRTLQKPNSEIAVEPSPATQPTDDASATPAPAAAAPLVTTELPSTTQPAPAAAAAAPAPMSDWDRALSTGVVPQSAPATQPIAALEAMDSGSNSLPASLSESPATQPAAMSAASPVTAALRTHKIEQGESFYTVAQSVYGDSSLYTRLEDANPNIDPKHLKIGMVINVPDASGAVAASAESSAPAAISAETAQTSVGTESARTYKVQPSDTLVRIARKLYGSSAAWQKIYDANRSVIGGNPARLKVGMVLQLPQSPTVASAH
jgi:nucleoid-associated protein YgaU